MKIALLGYGKMGKMIETMAVDQGHQIVLIMDEHNRTECTDEQLKNADVAIEFSVPDVAVEHYKWCFDCGVPVVSGTTGWLQQWKEVADYCADKQGSFFYASNYSIGVNLFFRLNHYLAELMNKFPDYRIAVGEVHHIHKLDAPSGTAITIAEGILNHYPDYHAWVLSDEVDNTPGVLPVVAKREGEIPGIHTVTYTSAIDEIQICHSAFSRMGFAQGVLLAAVFLSGKKGIYGMNDMMKELGLGINNKE